MVSLQSAYWDKVVSHTISELKAGRTPSPDILCNQRVKFGAFTDHIDATYDRIATGHYAISDTKSLYKAADPIKDQTYFLSHLSKEQLARCIFPLGALKKSEVRMLAKNWDLPNMARHDSQGICFLGKIKYNEFVKCHLGEKPGEIREKETNRLLGNHKGFWFHTVGQRKGLGLGGGPWFVVAKDVEKNIVYVANQSNKNDSEVKIFDISNTNWFNEAPKKENSYNVKIRHGAKTTKCHIISNLGGSNRITLELTEADGGIAPGQYAIVYDGNKCLGGGVIEHSYH